MSLFKVQDGFIHFSGHRHEGYLHTISSIFSIINKYFSGCRSEFCYRCNDRGQLEDLPHYVPDTPANLFLDTDGYLIDHYENRVQCIVKARLLLNLLKQLMPDYERIRVAIDIDGTYFHLDLMESSLEEEKEKEEPLGCSVHQELNGILYFFRFRKLVLF